MMEDNKNNKENNLEEKVTSRIRVSLEKVIPDARIRKLEDIKDTIKAYYVASNKGKKPLKYTDFKGYVDFSIQYVSGLNKFLEYIGFIQRIQGKAGYYVPTKDLLDYQKRLEWNDEEGANKIMKEILKKSWFYESASNSIQMKGKATEEDLIQRLGLDSGATKQHEPSLKLLVSLLNTTGLVFEENDEYILGKDVELMTEKEDKDEGLKDDGSSQEKVDADHDKKQGKKHVEFSQEVLKIPPISININISTDIEDEKLNMIFDKIKELINNSNNK